MLADQSRQWFPGISKGHHQEASMPEGENDSLPLCQARLRRATVDMNDPEQPIQARDEPYSNPGDDLQDETVFSQPRDRARDA
jgi:hypothetical protein